MGLSWRLVNSKYPFHVMHNLGQAGMARLCRVAIAKGIDKKNLLLYRFTLYREHRSFEALCIYERG